MLLTWLADELTQAGLTVVEYAGWQTRTMRPESNFHPSGLLNHHTAGSSVLYNYPNPPYWPDSRLDDKCNLTIRPDGTVVTLNAGYAYDSGRGAPEVLNAVLNDQPLPNLTGLTSTINGNPHFIDIEVQHLGDGSPIHPPQYEALIATNAVICKHMNWNPATRLIGHREWAPDRKTDPRWDGHSNPMPDIRQATANRMEGTIMHQLTALLQAMPHSWWQQLQTKTGTPAGDVTYWSGNRASAAEWETATPTILAATLTAAVTPGGIDPRVDQLARKLSAHTADAHTSTPHS